MTTPQLSLRVRDRGDETLTSLGQELWVPAPAPPIWQVAGPLGNSSSYSTLASPLSPESST